MVDSVTLGALKRMSFLEFSTQTAQTALGTTQATAFVLNNTITQFSTVASGTGALLPTTAFQHYGRIVYVANDGANALLIYPNSTDTINGGSASAAIEVPVGAVGIFVAKATGSWDAVISGGGVGLTVGGIATGSYSQANNTTLANVVGMSANVVAGGTYILDAYLSCSAAATPGIKLNLNGGTATATSFIADTWVYNTTTVTAEVNVTSISTNLVAAAVAATAVSIGGTLVVNAGGTIQLQAAQDVSNATALTIANGSYLQLTRLS